MAGLNGSNMETMLLDELRGLRSDLRGMAGEIGGLAARVANVVSDLEEAKDHDGRLTRLEVWLQQFEKAAEASKAERRWAVALSVSAILGVLGMLLAHWK